MQPLDGADMDMHHGRLVPGLVATVAGAALAGAYLAAAGLGADIGNSPASLAMVFAVFLVPGCASALVMELRARARSSITSALAQPGTRKTAKTIASDAGELPMSAPSPAAAR